jgi:hypothetical protein
LLKLKYEKTSQTINEQNSTIHQLQQTEKTEKSNYELKISEIKTSGAKDMENMKRKLDGKQKVIDDEKQ